MNKFAVILASHIPSVDKIWIGEDILKKIKQYLPTADIYVGINPSNCVDEWIKTIKKYTNKYLITPSDLVVGSDASSYQTALKLFKENLNDQYDLVWFLHTQATKSNRHDVRNRHLNNLIVNNNQIIESFMNDDNIGGFSSCYSPAPYINDEKFSYTEKILDKYYNFKYTPFRYITIGTMYVILGKILNNFLEHCNVDFFEKPLSVYPDQKTTDLYFFERDFIQIVNRSGYVVKSVIYQNDYLLKVNGETLLDYGLCEKFYKENLKNWKNFNNL
jgi:hypothetical protein